MAAEWPLLLDQLKLPATGRQEVFFTHGSVQFGRGWRGLFTAPFTNDDWRSNEWATAFAA
jgi:hypothetical protein